MEEAREERDRKRMGESGGEKAEHCGERRLKAAARTFLAAAGLGEAATYDNEMGNSVRCGEREDKILKGHRVERGRLRLAPSWWRQAVTLGGGRWAMGGVDRCDYWEDIQFESRSRSRDEAGMSESRTSESVQSAGGGVGFRQGEEVDSEFRSGRRGEVLINGRNRGL